MDPLFGLRSRKFWDGDIHTHRFRPSVGNVWRQGGDGDIACPKKESRRIIRSRSRVVCSSLSMNKLDLFSMVWTAYVMIGISGDGRLCGAICCLGG